MAIDDTIKSDLTGQSFGALRVLSYARRSYWNCECDCGRVFTVSQASLLGHATSRKCICRKRELLSANKSVHGLSETREYFAWQTAKNRCFNPKYRRFDRYGGRGITMCELWKNDFTEFLKELGPCPPGLELDRKDNEKGYEPGNCKWSTRIQQTRNQSRAIHITHEGETLLLKDWATRTGIPYLTLYARYRRGAALFGPSRYKTSKGDHR